MHEIEKEKKYIISSEHKIGEKLAFFHTWDKLKTIFVRDMDISFLN